MVVIICPTDSKNTLYDTYEFKEEIHTFNGDNYWEICSGNLWTHNFSTGKKYSKTLNFYSNLRISLVTIEVTHAQHRE